MKNINYFLEEIKNTINIIEDDYENYLTGFIHLNEYKKIFNINYQALNIIGFSSFNDLHDNNAYIKFISNNNALVDKVIKYIYDKKNISFQNKLIKNNNEEIFVDISIMVTKNEDRKHVYKIILEDINDKKNYEKELEYNLLLEETFNNISTLFNKKATINKSNISEIIRKFLNVSQGDCFFFNEKDEKYFELETIEYPIKKLNQQLFASYTNNCWFNNLKHGNSIICQDIEHLSDEVLVTKRILKSENIKSCCIFPVFHKDKLIAALTFYSTDNKEWLTKETKLIKKVSELFSYYIERKKEEYKLNYSLLLHKNMTKILNVIYTNKNTSIEESLSIIAESLRINNISVNIYNNHYTEIISQYKYSDGNSININNYLMNRPEIILDINRTELKNNGVESFISYPILSSERLLGNIELFFFKKRAEWLNEEEDFIKTFCETIGIYFQQKHNEKRFTDKSIEAESYLSNNQHLKEQIKLKEQDNIELMKNQELIRLITDCIPAMIAYVDKNQVYKFVNKRYEEWYDLPKEKIIGKTIADIKGKQIYKKIENNILKVLSGKEVVFEYEFSSYKRGNKPINSKSINEDNCFLKSIYIPHIGLSNKILGFFIMTEDVTEIRKVNLKLEQKKEELEISNKELANFAHTVSHDLKEPLGMISSYLQILKKWYTEDLNEDAIQFISMSLKGVERMNSMIKSLLSYAKADKSEKKFDFISFYDVIKTTQTVLIKAIAKNKVRLTYDMLPAKVYANQEQMIQVFQNLISNSIKYCKQERPMIHISSEKKEKEWIISIKDNGIGIRKDYHELIFNIFQRLHTEEDYPGDGVGLAICKKIIESHGGRIWVESQEGYGSTFFFTIPL